MTSPLPVRLADPDYEARRQRALERYGILDTEPEYAFDELTRLAALVCQTPISLISLMDHDRQWFKARVGLDVCEAVRDTSICEVALQQKTLLEVPDVTADPRFAQHDMVTGAPHMRFYAGVPLLTADNYCLGVICVIDRVVRTLTDAQRQALTTIAEQVMAQLELKRRKREQETGLQAHSGFRGETMMATVGEDIKKPLVNLLSMADLVIADARRGDALASGETLKLMNAELTRLQQCISALLEPGRR